MIVNNCPAFRKSEIEYYAILAKTGVHQFHGDNTELAPLVGSITAFAACPLQILAILTSSAH